MREVAGSTPGLDFVYDIHVLCFRVYNVLMRHFETSSRGPVDPWFQDMATRR
jgi:hypothetical protein